MRSKPDRRAHGFNKQHNLLEFYMLKTFAFSTSFEFSPEKSNMILFNNGSRQKELPQFKFDGQD